MPKQSHVSNILKKKTGAFQVFYAQGIEEGQKSLYLHSQNTRQGKKIGRGREGESEALGKLPIFHRKHPL